MTTRSDLRTAIRNQGLDQSTWDDTEINQYIADAIAEYSIHFPRYRESTGNACTADQTEYTLPSDCLEVIRVEYPEGEDPPAFLERLEPDDPRWGPGYYAVRGTTLVLGEEPDAGETYAVHYYAHHDYPDDDVTALTVPDEDLEVLIAFVIWKAYRRLELDEAKNPDGSTVILSMLGTNAARAQRQYQEALRARSGNPRGAHVSWGK